MEIKSSDKIANATAVKLQSKCKKIGMQDVDTPRSTNIAGIRGAAEAFAEINKMHLNYKQCLNQDAQAIKTIGRCFSLADKEFATKY